MDHPIACSCGAVKGKLLGAKALNRVVCYCSDCQAFAHYLGCPAEVLDAQGGSDIVQIAPRNLEFTQGFDQLVCLRLTPKGMLRWYASCCNTPIGNTAPTNRISFIGLLHNCLAGASLDGSFGPVRALCFTRAAKGDPKPKAKNDLRALGRVFAQLLGARLSGRYKDNPLFDRASGQPKVEPKIIEQHSNTRLGGGS